MTGYILRRLGAAVVVLFFVSFISFMLVNLAPGNTLLALLGQGVGAGVSQDVLDQFEQELGLDQPVLQRYGDWIGGVVQGDFGRSLRDRTPVIDEIAKRLPNSIELVLFASIFAVLFAVPIGVYSAVRQGSVGDYVSRVIAILGLAVPSFWLAVIIVVFIAQWIGVSLTTLNAPYPWEGLGDNLIAMIAPSIALGFVLLATTMRMMRSTVLEVMNEDYIRTARAKGLPEWKVIVKHGMRNALLPIITIIGLQLPFLFSGSVLVETIFAWPGMGRLIVSSIFTQDTPVIIGCFFVFTLLVVTGNVIADLLYSVVDPRIRYS